MAETPQAPAPKKGSLLKKILIGFVVVVLVFVGIVALQPNEFKVTRSATMGAPAATVFDQVNDFHKWEAWSPWEKLDPSMKRTFEGSSSGNGAIYSWVGNDKVGEGKMTLTESKPGELIKIRLDFVKPFEDTCNVEFAFKPEGDKTSVTWSMAGQNNFMKKAICMFMNMDKMVGGDFEKGLAQMKAVAEAPPKK